MVTALQTHWNEIVIHVANYFRIGMGLTDHAGTVGSAV